MNVNKDEKDIAHLKDIFKDDHISVSVEAPPKYLLPFLFDPQIVYVCKKKEITNELQFPRPEVNRSSESDSDDLDLTGNPLEAPFSSDDELSMAYVTKSREEDTHYPVDIMDVRRAISAMNLKLKLDIPFVALTRGCGSRDRTIVLGSSKNDNWYSRFWVNVQDFTVDGPKVTNVDEMIKKHYKLSFSNWKETLSEVTCQYIMESTGDAHATLLQESNGCVLFNLTWKTPSFHVPADKIDVAITINSSIGHENSDIATPWNHLILLCDYLEMIKKWEHDRSAGLYSRHTAEFPNIRKLGLDETNPKSLQERLSHLLQEPNEALGGVTSSRITINEKKTLEETVRKVNTMKKEEEFTDRLWALLIECTSYEELYACIDQVFQAIRNGTCKPYIKSTNITRLAYAIRCCRNDPNMFSAAFEPLELLIEIGIEKLKKEFLSIFLLAKIATAEQLTIPALPKFPDIAIMNWKESCEQWILWLVRLHISLQLMLLTENTVKFRGCLHSLTSLTLRHYCGPDSPIKDFKNPRSITSESFTTALDAANINDLINRKTPFNSWKLKLSSETENRRVTSLYYRDMNDTFPASVGVSDNMDGSGNNTYTLNAFPYHCYDFHCVSDRIA